MGMNPNTNQVCSSCGERYGWSVSFQIMLGMVAVVLATVALMVTTAPLLSAPVLLASLAGLLTVSTVIALSAFKPVPL